jgi:hypothetical protein
LRWLVRRSGARSPNSAPTTAATSTSINSTTTPATASRITSTCSDAITLSTACPAVILRPSAIAWCSLKSDCCNQPDDSRPAMAVLYATAGLLHHFYRHDHRWFLYDDVGSSRDVEPLLAEIEQDPTGIFWG